MKLRLKLKRRQKYQRESNQRNGFIQYKKILSILTTEYYWEILSITKIQKIKKIKFKINKPKWK